STFCRSWRRTSGACGSTTSFPTAPSWRWCRRFSSRRLSRQSGRRSRLFTVRSSRRWSMSKKKVGRVWQAGRVGQVTIAIAVSLVSVYAADNGRQIVEEAQTRTDAKSQRYEGLLQVFDAKGNVSDKRWSMERLGSHGNSKAVLRFTAPAEVKGVALLVVNHPD